MLAGRYSAIDQSSTRLALEDLKFPHLFTNFVHDWVLKG